MENNFEIAAFESSTLYTRFVLLTLLKDICPNITFNVRYDSSYFQYFKQSILPTCSINFIHPKTKKTISINVSSYLCGYVEYPFILFIDRLCGHWSYKKDFNNLVDITEFIKLHFRELLNLSECYQQLSLFDF